MAVFKVHKDKNFTTISNFHLREKGLSFKAKGILTVMLSLPDDWDYSIAGLASLSGDGMKSVRSGIQELERFGYVKRTQAKDEKGFFSGYEYDVYERPQKDEEASYPSDRYPSFPFGSTEKGTQLKTKEPITKEPKDKKDRKDRTDKSREARLPDPSPSPSLGITEKEYKLFDKMRDREAIEREVYMKPTALTKMLVSGGYLPKDDPYTSDYNLFLGTLKDEYGFENVRDCVSYFLVKTKGNRGEIADRMAYFKASMLSGLANYTRDWNKVYELAGGK